MPEKKSAIKKIYITAIDIGNSDICFVQFYGKRIVKRLRVATPKSGDKKRLTMPLQNAVKKISQIYPQTVFVVASVAPRANALLKQAVLKIARKKIFFLEKDIPVPVKNFYRNKKEVGTDRLVNALAAFKLLHKKSLVIDFGTAVTFDFVSEQGAYLGGMIFPGVNVSLTALSDMADLLPTISLKKPRGLIGKDTVTSMRGGMCYGYGSICDGMQGLFEQKYGSDIGVVATGGQARLIAKFASKRFMIDEDLTVKGICECYLIANSCEYSLFE